MINDYDTSLFSKAAASSSGWGHPLCHPESRAVGKGLGAVADAA